MAQDIKIDFSNYLQCINPVFHPYIEDTTHRYCVFLGGRGSGKSIFCGQKIIYDMLLSKTKYLIIRKTFNSIRKSVIPMLKSLIDQYGLSQFFVIRQSDLSIECIINGSEIVCAGLDDEQKLRSLEGCQRAFIEEISELSEQDFTAIDVLLRGPGFHQILAAFNPLGPEHWL